jgi:hypothetical protein
MQMPLVVEMDMGINQAWYQKPALSINYFVCSVWAVANDSSVYDHRSAVTKTGPIKHADVFEKAFSPGSCGFCRRHGSENGNFEDKQKHKIFELRYDPEEV